MQLDRSLLKDIAVEDAIDRSFLIVEPDLPATEAIALMSAARGSICDLQTESYDLDDSVPEVRARASCLLVKRDDICVGIFTERDIVRLTAQQVSLENISIGEIMHEPVIVLAERAFQDVFAPLFLFRRYGIRHLPIVDDTGRAIGIVSAASIRRTLRPSNLLKRRRVAEVMASEVVRASPETTVLELARLMAKHRVSCVAIVEVEVAELERDRAEEMPRLHPVGIVTERDIVQFQALQLDLAKVRARDVMSAPLFLLSPEDSLWHAHQAMEQRHVWRLLVSWNWGLGLGIVTQTSLLKVFDPMEMYGVIEALQQTIRELKAGTTDPDSFAGIPGAAADLPSVVPPESELPATATSDDLMPRKPDAARILETVGEAIVELIENPSFPDAVRQSKLERVSRELAVLQRLIAAAP